MKPKTKLEKLVAQLSSQLPPITDTQKQWAFEHCFSKVGFYQGGKVWCLHCGSEFEYLSSSLGISVLPEKATCPVCGKKITLENRPRKTIFKESWYYSIITTKSNFQICRHFIVSKYIRKGSSPCLEINEAVQNWIYETGKEIVVARPCKPSTMCYDLWDFAKPMEIRLSMRDSKYNICGSYVYPKTRLLPIIKRNGYTSRVNCFISPNNAFRMIIRDREAEMLIKNNQFSLLQYKHVRYYKEYTMPFAHSIRIANRNKYIVKDASMWIDYLDLLEYFHLDTYNAHYVCPRNLKAEHDKLLARKRRIEEKIALEKKIAEAKKWEAKYRESKGKFFGICFGNENINISVISSVAEMAEEGKVLHHCVYTNEYYKKKDSLILSAKNSEGARMETIEVSLKSFRVVQSRGFQNGTSIMHREILKLVENNINRIKSVV